MRREKQKEITNNCSYQIRRAVKKFLGAVHIINEFEFFSYLIPMLYQMN